MNLTSKRYFTSIGKALRNIFTLAITFGKTLSIDKNRFNTRVDNICNYLMENIINCKYATRKEHDDEYLSFKNSQHEVSTMFGIRNLLCNDYFTESSTAHLPPVIYPPGSLIIIDSPPLPRGHKSYNLVMKSSLSLAI
jgi:hypothetical protein